MRKPAVSKGIGFQVGAVFPDASFYPRARSALRKLVEGSFVGDELAYVGRLGGTLRKLTPRALETTMKDRESRTWWLTSSKATQPDVSFECHRFIDDLSVTIRLRDARWVSHGPTLAADIEALSWSMVDTFGKRARIDGTLFLAFQPAIRVPKALGRGPYHPNAVVDLFCRRDPLRRQDPAWARMLDKMLSTPLPPTVRVVERDDMVMWFWTDDLGTEKALRAACRQRQQWLVKTLWT